MVAFSVGLAAAMSASTCSCGVQVEAPAVSALLHTELHVKGCSWHISDTGPEQS